MNTLKKVHLEGLPPPDVAAVEGALVGHLALGAVQGLVLGRLLAPRRRGLRVTYMSDHLRPLSGYAPLVALRLRL